MWPSSILTQVALLACALPVLAVGASVVYQASRIVYLRWKYRHIPGPTPHLLLGNIPQLVKMGGSHIATKHWTDKYGPVFKLFFLNRMFVVVSDPDAAHQMLYRFTNRPKFVNPVIHLLPGKHIMLDDNGILVARDSFWRMLRNAWQPAFAPGSLRSYAALMQGCAQQLVAGIHAVASGSSTGPAATTNGHAGMQHAAPRAGAARQRSIGAAAAGHAADGEPYVDIHDLFNSMTLEVVGTCAYGVRFNALTAGQDGSAEKELQDQDWLAGVGPRLQKACTDFFGTATIASGTKWAVVYGMVPFARRLIAWLAHLFPDPPYTRMINSRTTILDTSETLINEWRTRHPDTASSDAAHLAAPASSHTASMSKPVGPQGRMAGVQPGSFLGLLLEAQQKAARGNSKDQMDNITLAAQANTFILAGTETTGNTLSHAVYFLCQHPDKLARLLQEVDAHGYDTPISPDDKFPYAEAVINETLRLIPSAPITTRLVDRPEGVEVLGHTVYAGDALMVPVYVLHRDPHAWPRAEEFLPERWLPEGETELGTRNPNAYAPFGAGARQCIGFKFALQEARIALVQVYKHFTFKLQPGQVPLKLAAGFTLGPKHGLLVQPSFRHVEHHQAAGPKVVAAAS